jgi:hypothetical protein
MCCESEHHRGGKRRGHHHGCCCGHSGFGPCSWTEEEKIAWLEQHLEGLQGEVKTVEERIAALKGEE